MVYQGCIRLDQIVGPDFDAHSPVLHPGLGAGVFVDGGRPPRAMRSGERKIFCGPPLLPSWRENVEITGFSGCKGPIRLGGFRKLKIRITVPLNFTL
jgi:hypothetical protein